MRIIGIIDNEKDAYAFCAYLSQQNIANKYESARDSEAQKRVFQIWVYDENDLDMAEEAFKQFKDNPNADHFSPPVKEVQSFPPVELAVPNQKQGVRGAEGPKIKVIKVDLSFKKRPYPITYLFLVLCAFLFFFNGAQEEEMAKAEGPIAIELRFTPIQRELIFDYPSSIQAVDAIVASHDWKSVEHLKDLPPEEKALLQQAEDLPTWRGLYDLILHWPKGGWETIQHIPLFEKIKEGEVWRLFTPCLLHRDFLHILFNMAWLWVLGRQIEERLRKGRMLLFALFVGIVSNVLQYLVSGPYFLGFSGIVVAMAGFIWMRQKIAPWEGYPLNRTTLLFILLFVVAMFGLELVMFTLQLLGWVKIPLNVANTAHVVGGLIGILLGKLSFFKRVGA